MLQQTALSAADDTLAPEQALDAIARQREYRRINREKHRLQHLSDDVIDRLDLQSSETLASADGAFAAALERAIESGAERDIDTGSGDHGTERPMIVIAPRALLPEQIPAVPARMTEIAAHLVHLRETRTAEERQANHAEKLAACERERGALTVLDLRVGLCKFSTSESSPYFFCGAATGSDAKPWCPQHHRVCFPPRS